MTDKPTRSPAQAGAADDPMAVFATRPEEREGVEVELEHPTTGKVLMTWRIRRFGGSNNAKIIRANRELKGKLTQGQRRAIDNGTGDPDIVERLNRQVFIRVAVLGFTAVDPQLKERWPEYSEAAADAILEAYPKVYDILSEKAIDEETFEKDRLEERLGN